MQSRQVGGRFAPYVNLPTMSRPDDDPQIAQLRQSVADLAASQRALQLRVEALTTILEQRADTSFEAAASTPLPPAPPAPRRSFTRRAARFLLRKTLGTARKLWDAAHPDPPWADEIVFVRGEKARPLPRLFLPESAAEADDEDLIWTSTPPDDLPANFAAIVCRLAAIEHLSVLRWDLAGGSSWIVRKALWDAEEGLDLAALALAVTYAETPLGKVLGPSSLDGPLPEFLSRGPLLRRSGRHLVAATDTPRSWNLALHPPPPTEEPAASEAAAWIVVREPLARGLDRMLARTLQDDPDVAIAILAGDDLSRRRAADLARISPRVWYLGDFEEACFAELLPSLGATPDKLREPSSEPVALTVDPQDRAALRRELGADESTVVVLWGDDLVPEAHPEDFVTTAHALRDRPEFLFVIDGEGSRLSAVRDLRAYLGVERLTIVTRPTDAAADVVCCTAAMPFPERLEAARAGGLRVLGPEDLEAALREIDA